MKRKLILVVLGTEVFCIAFAAATPQKTCQLTPIQFDQRTSTVTTGEFAIHFEQPDSPLSPTVWDGPINIRNRKTDAVCTVQMSGLIDRPLVAFDDRFLVLATFSGSNFRIETVNLSQCTTNFLSDKLTGPVTFTDGRVLANGQPVKGFQCTYIR